MQPNKNKFAKLYLKCMQNKKLLLSKHIRRIFEVFIGLVITCDDKTFLFAVLIDLKQNALNVQYMHIHKIMISLNTHCSTIHLKLTYGVLTTIGSFHQEIFFLCLPNDALVVLMSLMRLRIPNEVAYFKR